MAIGGGAFEETAPIDRVLLGLTGRPNPRVLFIPTASGDAEDYVLRMSAAYRALGAEVHALRLYGPDGERELARRKIEEADAVYVGGGNTKAMIARWQELGVDEALRCHLEAGKPAGGLSAGALCWFRVGNSDWPRYEEIPGVNTAPLECLGFVDLALCPHTRDEGFRLDEFREMMRGVPGAGVGLDDGCAIQIRGDEYRILAVDGGSKAHLLFSSGGVVKEADLPAHGDFRPLDALRRGVV